MDRYYRLTDQQLTQIKKELNSIKRVKIAKSNFNIKEYIESFYNYISGDDTHFLMKELNIKGDRWTHNLSKKEFRELIKHKKKEHTDGEGWLHELHYKSLESDL